MALIREVARHENSRMWAFIEYSDEDEKILARVLGDKHFATQGEAEEYSNGFAPDSYDWVEPEDIKRSRLTKEKEKLEARLRVIDDELENVRYLLVRDCDGEEYIIPEGSVAEFKALDTKILEIHDDPSLSLEYYSTCDEFNDKFGEYKR